MMTYGEFQSAERGDWYFNMRLISITIGSNQYFKGTMWSRDGA